MRRFLWPLYALQDSSDLLRQSSHRLRTDKPFPQPDETKRRELTSADDDQVVRVLGGGQPALGDPRADDRASRRRPCQSLPISRESQRRDRARKGSGGLTRDEETRESISVQVYVTRERERLRSGGAAPLPRGKLVYLLVLPFTSLYRMVHYRNALAHTATIGPSIALPPRPVLPSTRLPAGFDFSFSATRQCVSLVGACLSLWSPSARNESLRTPAAAYKETRNPYSLHDRE